MDLNKIIQMLLSVIYLLAPQLKKEESKEGVKETREALVGVNEVSLFLAVKLQDGAQFSDATDFYKKLTEDAAFKKVIEDAYEGYDKIPAEVKDIDGAEALELAAVQIEYVPKFIDALKKKES